MKLSKAIKKIEKATGVTAKKIGHHYSAIIGTEVIEFHTQQDWQDKEGEESIVCISTRDVNQHSDAMTDYFPQTWHDNITQAIKFALIYSK